MRPYETFETLLVHVGLNRVLIFSGLEWQISVSMFLNNLVLTRGILLCFLVPQMFTADCRMCCLIDRSDKTLEDIIYKLIPKLQESKTFKCMKTVTINLTLNRPI